MAPTGSIRARWLWAVRSITSPAPAWTRPSCKCAMRSAVAAMLNVKSVRGKCWGTPTITSASPIRNPTVISTRALVPARASPPTLAIALTRTWKRASTCVIAKPPTILPAGSRVTRSAMIRVPPTASMPPAIQSACNRAPPGLPTRPPCGWTIMRGSRSGWPITITPWTCAKAPTASKLPTPISAAP